MKKLYIFSLAFFFTLLTQAQKQDPFDTRSSKTTNHFIRDAAIEKAGIVDGRKSNLKQEYIYKAGPFLKAEDPAGFIVIQDPGSITPNVIYRKNGHEAQGKTFQGADAACYNFLNEVRPMMKVIIPENEFKITHIEYDALGMTHVRMEQKFMDIPVYGCEIILHGHGNLMEYMNGNSVPTPALNSVTSGIQPGQAVQSMLQHLSKRASITELTNLQKQILHYQAPQVSLIALPQAGAVNCKLSYHIVVRPDFIQVWHYFIDANTGEVLDFYNATCKANGPRTASATDLNGVNRTINTYEYNGKFYLINASKPMFDASASVFPDAGVGVIETYNANNTDGTSLYNINNTTNSGWSSTAVSAHYNADIAYDYYKSTFNRNSINGSGGTITSIVNVTYNGSAMDNAYWNGEAMFYGNGSSAFKPLAGALDVGGHELTHGVVQNTANLEYKGQAGAINESMADVFGCMIDRADWKMGEDITKTSYIPTGCLRDLSNPHNGGSGLSDNGWQPAKMSEYYTGTQDNGGVHINSGIPNKAFYLFATATTKEKAERVYYRALSLYLTKTSKFLDLRYAVVKAATDLYTASSAEVAAAKAGFDQVEIFDPNEATGGGTGGGGTTQITPDDLSVNPGQDYILSYDVSGGSTKLYRSSTTGTNYLALTSTDQKNRVTVPDNGSYCMFVDNTGNIVNINLSSPYKESKLTTSGGWDNISISKDGKLLAAVSTSIDTAIYIYNFALQQWKKVHLYNPTYSGVNSAGVNYADGIEWDNTGQYVIYDAHNVIKNNSGTDKTYWDVGIVKVWDLKSNTWGDGKIEKLFTSLPEDVSIGNPIFSKNSPYVIAFDYIDNSGTNPEYAVIGTNIITNKTSVIANNTTLGYPNYSRTDTKLIYDGEDLSSNENIYVINLNPDKISASGSSSQLIPDAKWGYWYATGTRALLASGKNILAFSISNITPPVTATINGTNITAVVPPNTNLGNLVATFSLSYDAIAKKGAVEQVSGVTANDFSTSVVYTITAQDGTTKNYNVTVTKGNGILSNQDISSFSVYPNPFTNEITLKFPGEFNYELMDITGKEIIRSAGVVDNSVTLDAGYLTNGIYLVRLRSRNETKLFRIVKQ